MSNDTRPGHRTNRKKAVADNARAHDAAGISKPAGKLDQTRALLRARLAPRRELQAVFDELATEAPTTAALALVSAYLVTQVAEEKRLLAAVAEQVAKIAAGAAPDGVRQRISRRHAVDDRAAQAVVLEGIRAQLQEHRRCTRHLVAVSAALAKAVKVAFDVKAAGGTDNVTVKGTGVLRAHTTTPDDAIVH